MPELPEVETIARGLRTLIRGKKISGVRVAWARTVDARSLPLASLAGQRIEDVGRIGKFVAITMEDGRTLAIHLRMTGSLQVEPRSKPARSPRAAGHRFRRPQLADVRRPAQVRQSTAHRR